MAKRKQRKSVGKSEKSRRAGKSKPQSKPRSARKPQARQTDAAPVTTHRSSPQAQPEPIAVPASLPNASTLLDELQQRCESLRQWQRQANEDVRSRLARIQQRESELDETARQVEHERTRLDLDLDAFKRARLILDKEKAQVEQTQQALEAERQHLQRSRTELNDQKQELQDLRSEMDAEWASLARIRRAQESLAAALDADRARVRDPRLADSPGEPGIKANDQNTDDAPGLSLTQAA